MAFQSGQIRIKGAAEMAAMLRKLPDEIRDKVLRAALRKSAAPILKTARGLAPYREDARTSRTSRRVGGAQVRSDYGHLRPNLRVVTVRSRGTNADATVLVSTGDAFWGLFVELGRRGRPMRLTPFLGPAFAQNKERALDALGVELGKGIEKAAAKLYGKPNT